MGYDMSIVEPTAEDAAIQKRKWELANKFLLAQSMGATNLEELRSLALQSPQDPGYFRLNIWGMGEYRDRMEELGMGHWCEIDELNPWPHPQDFEDGEEDPAFEAARKHKLSASCGGVVSACTSSAPMTVGSSRNESVEMR